MNSQNDVWSLPALSDLSDKEKGAFYDELASDSEGSNFFSSKNPRCWESSDWKVGIIRADGTIVSAYGQPSIDADDCNTHVLKPGSRVDLVLDKVYFYQLPCKNFTAQLLIESTHKFDNHSDCNVGYCLTAKGTERSALEFLGDICFKSLKVDTHLSLKVATNLLADRSAEKIVSFFSNAPIKQGLKLSSLYDPAFSLILSYMNAATIALLEKNKNKMISKIQLSLNTTPGAASIALLQASYVLLQNWQYPDSTFSWNGFKWSSDASQLLKSSVPCQENYYIMRIKSHEDG